jgi:hypothetical protein
MLRSITLAALISCLIATAGPAPVEAHGKPEHGGGFCEVKEYTFEVVAKRDGDNVNFSVYVKDPALKPVSTGALKLVVTLADKKQETVALTAGSDGVYTGSSKLPKRGRYKVGVSYDLPAAKKPLTCSVSVKES